MEQHQMINPPEIKKNNTLSNWAGLALHPNPTQTGSGELWIQATAHSFVGHITNPNGFSRPTCSMVLILF